MLYNDAEQLKEELRELFRERCTKEELLTSLAVKLGNYPQLTGTLFQYALNEFIIDRAEDDCEVLIYDEEINQLWK